MRGKKNSTTVPINSDLGNIGRQIFN